MFVDVALNGQDYTESGIIFTYTVFVWQWLVVGLVVAACVFIISTWCAEAQQWHRRVGRSSHHWHVYGVLRNYGGKVKVHSIHGIEATQFDASSG